MSRISFISDSFLQGVFFAAMLNGVFHNAHAAENLPIPNSLIVVDEKEAAPLIQAARRYAAFWNTGDPTFSRAALAPDFIDQTLPPGRPQGPEGPLQASRVFRTAVPDLTAEIDKMIVAGDRVVVHLRFRGHFTGQFGDKQGQGQALDFQAFDLYRIKQGRISDNWHLEDYLTMMRQMGIVK